MLRRCRAAALRCLAFSACQHAQATAPATTATAGPWNGRLTRIASEWSPKFPGYVAGTIEAASLEWMVCSYLLCDRASHRQGIFHRESDDRMTWLFVLLAKNLLPFWRGSTGKRINDPGWFRPKAAVRSKASAALFSNLNASPTHGLCAQVRCRWGVQAASNCERYDRNVMIAYDIRRQSTQATSIG